ncbi:MAG: chemotaxis protein CheW [Sphingopyxis sp.]
MDEMLREFVGETLDMMEAIGGDLVAWQIDPSDRRRLDSIFRAIHTVKGSSSFFELPRVTAISHAAENILEILRARKNAPDRKSVSIILRAFDHIRALAHAIAQDGFEPEGDDSELLAVLSANFRVSDRDQAERYSRKPSPPKTGQPENESEQPGSVPIEWRSVRVPLGLLDTLMNGVSDLVLARNDFALQLRASGIEPADLAGFDRFSEILSAVRGSVSQMRMVPLLQLFAPLPRLVHSLCDELGKNVSLTVDGGQVEIDREVIESLRDPIIHVIRNAIDHGIEDSEGRLAAGKAATAQLSISGRHDGNRIAIVIEDDGRGLDDDGLIERAIAAGHLTDERVSGLTQAQIANLIFLPGLSTAQSVTGISGRGVGMDVVKANVEKLGGSVRIHNRPGQGVMISIDVPMTLTIISALAIDVDGQGFALPRNVVDEVLLASNDSVQRVEAGGALMVRVRGRMLPLVVLEPLLGLESSGISLSDRALILCRVAGSRSFVLDVPDVRDHDELVIKPLPPTLMSIGLYAGFSLPDNGRPMLLLDVDGIANHAVARAPQSQPVETMGEGEDGSAEQDERWLCYRGWEQSLLSAVPMANIERLIDVNYTQLTRAGGRIVANINEEMVAVDNADFALPNHGSDTGTVRMIWASHEHSHILIPVRDVVQLVPLKMRMPAQEDSKVALGLALFEGDIVEMIDIRRLIERAFAQVKMSDRGEVNVYHDEKAQRFGQ